MKLIKKLNDISSYMLCIFICLIIVYVYGRVILDPNPIVLGESLNFWTYGLAAIKESIFVFHQFPLWDSHIGAGFSLIGHPYIQQFYPFIYPFIFLISDPILATRFFIFFHILSAGILFFLLLLFLKIPKIAGFFGTIIYINSHFFYLYIITGLFSSIFTLTWLPLILLFFIKSLKSQNNWYAIVSAFLISLLIFMGGLYTTIFTIILLFFFYFSFLLLLIFKKGSNEVKKQEILSLIKTGSIFIVFIFLFSAVKFLPIIEYRNISNREVISLVSAESNLSPIATWKEILYTINSFFTPLISKNQTQANVINYVFLFFIILGIFSKRRIILIPVLLFTIIACLAALGHRFIIDIYSFFYYIIPGFKSFGTTTRFLVLTWFTLPLLASLGLEVFMQLMKRRLLIAFNFISFVFMVVVLILIIGNQKKQIENYPLSLYEVPKSILYIKELSEKDKNPFRVYNKWITGHHSGYNYAAIQNNLTVVSPLYTGAVPNFMQLDFTTKEKNLSILEKKQKLFEILNTKYLISTKSNQDPRTSKTKIVKTFNYQGETGYITELLQFRQRIDFIPIGILLVGEEDYDSFNAIKVRSIILLPEYNIYKSTIFSGKSSYLEDYKIQDLEAFSVILLHKNKIKNEEKFKKIVYEFEQKGGLVINGFIFSENEQVKRRAPNSLFTNNPAFIPNNNLKNGLKQVYKNIYNSRNIEILKREERQGSIVVDFSIKEKGFIVISESFYPGWEAKIDGKNTKLFMADSMVMGVVVNTPGKHTLTLSYKPKSFIIGGLISVSIIGFILVILGWKLYKRTHGHENK